MAPEGTRHMLVLEPDARGHALEWLTHLARCTRGLSLRLSMAVAPGLATPLAEMMAAESIDDIRVATLAPGEVAGCLASRLATSAFSRWRAMGRYARDCGADTGFFLGLDHLSLPLALQLPTHGLRLAGILFRPSVHYPSLGPYRPGAAERLRDVRKRLLYPAMLRHPALAALFSLDPYFTPYARRHYRHGSKVHTIPDPAAPLPAGLVATSPAVRFPVARTRFVLFGSLTERKGVFALIEALARLEPEIARKIAVAIAGQVDPAIRAELRTRLRKLSATRPELWLRLVDRWLSDREVATLVEASDAVLAPYQRFVGSSGVLLWAAKLGRPIVTQSFGLLGRFARDYRLGLAVDTTNPSEIADAIARIARSGPAGVADPAGMARFAANRSPGDFVATIVDRLVETKVPTPIAERAA